MALKSGYPVKNPGNYLRKRVEPRIAKIICGNFHAKFLGRVTISNFHSLRADRVFRKIVP
jgi:hypothetical protein